MTEQLNLDINQPIMEQYNNYYDNWYAQSQANQEWLKGRIKHLGYKSMAQFVRTTSIPVTAGTVTNYFRGHSSIPLYMIKHLCYALKVTPNDLLTVIGEYDPSKQEVDHS